MWFPQFASVTSLEFDLTLALSLGSSHVASLCGLSLCPHPVASLSFGRGNQTQPGLMWLKQVELVACGTTTIDRPIEKIDNQSNKLVLPSARIRV